MGMAFVRAEHSIGVKDSISIDAPICPVSAIFAMVGGKLQPEKFRNGWKEAE
jgi:hypothetical protein